MFTVNSYLLAVIFCIVTMICWGSWGNTQKLVSKIGVMNFLLGLCDWNGFVHHLTRLHNG